MDGLVRGSGALAALLVAAVVVGCGVDRAVYRGGTVLTMNATDDVVEAIGVEGDRIGAVGTAEEVLAWAGATARIVELDGKAVVPGFVDAHGHFPGEGALHTRVDLNAPPIGDVETLADLQARLRAGAATVPEGEWLIGVGYDDTLLAELRHPTRHDLDAVTRSHPLAVLHVSGHLAVVNSLALEQAGLDRDSPDPEGGVRRRDADGELTGVLEESATHFVQAQLFEVGLLDSLQIVREASRLALSRGVTTVQSGGTPGGLIAPLQWTSRLGLIEPRIVVWPAAEVIDEVLAGERTLPQASGPDFWLGAVKLIADGSIQGYTGYLSEPYHVPPPGDLGFRGYPVIPRDELRERVTRYHAAGWQVAVHGNGDASIEDILDAFEHAFQLHPRSDARPIVIHAQMTRPDQLDRMARLEVLPSFFSLHTFYWGDRHRTLFMGPERAARMSPAATALAKGVRFTIHCDSPVVPLEPLRLVWAAVNRRTRSGVTVGPDERISPMQALRATTIDAAYSMRLEDHLGSLEVGKFADLAILSASPLDEPATIDHLRVVETVRGGQSVYRASD